MVSDLLGLTKENDVKVHKVMLLITMGKYREAIDLYFKSLKESFSDAIK